MAKSNSIIEKFSALLAGNQSAEAEAAEDAALEAKVETQAEPEPEDQISQEHVDELLQIKDRQDTIYQGKNSIQVVNDGDYPLYTNQLGSVKSYANKKGGKLLLIRHGKIDGGLADFLITMHEYGHIALGHMKDDQNAPNSPFRLIEELYNIIDEDGAALAEQIAKNCGIDVELAEQYLTRFLDDPDLLHKLLNYSMDMSVNTCVLEPNDVHIIEKIITRKFKQLNRFDNRKAKLVSNIEDMTDKDTQAELKGRLKRELERLLRRVQDKLVLPENYFLGEDENGNKIPFPNGRPYYEYFRMLVDHLDQFVTFLASLRLGKPKEQLSGADIAAAMQQEKEEFEFKKGYRQANRDYQERLAGKSNKSIKDYPNESDQFKAGYQKSVEDIAQALLDENDSPNNSNEPNGEFEQESDDPNSSQGQGDGEGEGQDEDQDDGSDEGGDAEGNCDHGTPELDSYLKDMEDGTVGDPDSPKNIHNRGGKGRSTNDTPAVFRQVKVDVDPLDQFLTKVSRGFRNTVNKVKPKKNIMRKHNLRKGSGRGRVIVPTIRMKLQKDSEPRVVFLIDISGSMDTNLIDRVLKTISVSLKNVSTKTRYDVITWNTDLATHYRNLDPRNPLTSFPCGGGTDLADGIKYFGQKYNSKSVLIVISDFEDNLDAWNNECDKLPGYKIYGINYGRYSRTNTPWRNFTEYRF
jgi:hypothetical protein